MKHVFTCRIKLAKHFLAERKTNKQVNQVLDELFPHITDITCTKGAFEDFIDVMWAKGFVVEVLDVIGLDKSGNKIPRKPVKNEDTTVDHIPTYDTAVC